MPTTTTKRVNMQGASVAVSGVLGNDSWGGTWGGFGGDLGRTWGKTWFLASITVSGEEASPAVDVTKRVPTINVADALIFEGDVSGNLLLEPDVTGGNDILLLEGDVVDDEKTTITKRVTGVT